MFWEAFLCIVVMHNWIGFMFTCFFNNCYGFEYVNPNWIYQNYKINKFGCIILTILYNLICPIGTIIYWSYKLCTIGRK